MNNYFCVLPFFGYEFSPNGGSHCCLLPKNYNITALRNDMLNGKRSPFCSACWKLEDSNLLSDRKLKNSALDFYWDKDIRFIEEEVHQGKYKTIMVKNSTSNTCNSTCVTCSSGASSAWAPLEQKMGKTPHSPMSMTKNQIDINLKFDELVMLNFVGGEPLYEKLNFYILEKLLEHNNTNCFIAVTTNGSLDISDSRKELLQQFKNINFNISVDGVGPVFEYLRYPLKWDKLLKNLEFFRTVTDNISVSNTTSNMNVMYYHQTINWFKEQGLNYHYNPVINPTYFRPSALPRAVKEEILRTQGHTPELEFFIGAPHTDKDDRDFAQFLNIIKIQDQVKGINMINYLPEFCELIRFSL